jgi:eukaryotic-like serine/threonine-protein kinase
MIPLHRSSCVLVFVALTCILLLQPVTAADHVVAPSGAEFTTLKDAVDWSSGGDTIRVESGTYSGNLKLDKKLILIGVDSGGGPPVITPSKGGNVIEITANGCSVQGFIIGDSASASAIYVTSSNNAIRRNTLKNNAVGISLVSAVKNTVENNVISGNTRAGIVLASASGNLIDSNTIKDNTVGLTQDESSRANTISRNTFANTQNVVSKSLSSMWSTAAAYSYTYLGRAEQGRMGNYWNDYHGKDQNGDGIGDTTYITGVSTSQASVSADENHVDGYPLMDPLEYYTGISSLVTGGTSGSVALPVPSATPPVKPVITTAAAATTTRPAATPTSSPPGASPSPAGPAAIPASQTPQTPQTPQAPPGIPLTAVALVLIGMVLAGIGAWLFIARKQDGPLPSPMPVVNRAASALKTVVERTRALIATSSQTTVLSEETAVAPHPSATDQKNYFPRELENKYTGIEFVGRGGIAWVFAAVRKTDGEKVAVKIPISFDEVTGKCFLNEIAAWETLRHPNIVEVTAVNILPVPYVEMEFVPGSLEAVVKPMPVWKAVHLITGVTDGLRYAHEHGFIHRDIKPHNILLTPELVPKITDWGMSKVLAADVKKSSVAGFSLSYAAPEQVSPSEFGRTDERTDIYQLGVVFYELVTGSIPFGGESIVEVGNAILREEAIRPSEYNPDAEAVEKIILKCLKKDPAARYQSASELHDALQGYLDEDDE